MIVAEKIERAFGSTFVSEYLRSPLRVGAIVPSSEQLAAAITDGLSQTNAPVIELGPGTGVFTRALLDRGISPDQIAAIELNNNFVRRLSIECPDVTIVQGDAARVHRLTPFGANLARVLICGLPLLSMPTPCVVRVLKHSFCCLVQDGEFRLFSYSPRCPVPSRVLARLGLVAKRSTTVWRNAPPATVYVIKRTAPIASARQTEGVP